MITTVFLIPISAFAYTGTGTEADPIRADQSLLDELESKGHQYYFKVKYSNVDDGLWHQINVGHDATDYNLTISSSNLKFVNNNSSPYSFVGSSSVVVESYSDTGSILTTKNNGSVNYVKVEYDPNVTDPEPTDPESTDPEPTEPTDPVDEGGDNDMIEGGDSMFSNLTTTAITTEATTWASNFEAVILVVVGIGVAFAVTRFVKSLFF